MYEYDLFAVVCHEGQIDNGHYTCFARSQDEVRKLLSFDVSYLTLSNDSGTDSMTTSRFHVAWAFLADSLISLGYLTRASEHA